ncbi:MAG: carbohydrate-binding domain-containing protein [Lachnospiraceae bacterium]|nr:carbohydrate-binding domain-containing protein [Lachnospiraceae bacterium]
MIKRKRYQLFSMLCAMLLMLGGCGQSNGSAEGQKDSLAEAPGKSNNGKDNVAIEQNTDNIGIALLDIEDMFSDRDKEIGFDEATDTLITLAGSSAICNSESVVVEGSTVTITDEGTYILTGNLENGQIVVDAEDSDKLQIVLNGADITCETSAAVYVKEADKVFITLAANTENSLAVTKEFAEIDDNNIDSAIFSKADLTVNGTGNLKISTAKGHGIVSKDDLVITDGIIEIQAAGHGLEGKDSVRIADGKFEINVEEDGIHSENDDDSELGFVYIAGGEYIINAKDDGIHAGAQLVIDEGNISIQKCEEGLEGQTVDVRGGNLILIASDDGINATSPKDADEEDADDNPFEVDANAYIRISGGTVEVTAYGDGLDSNGGLEITGGAIYVSGPENSGNGSIDYTGAGKITGGILVAAGHSGMTQNLGESSTQGSMLVNLSETMEAGSEVKLLDGAGKELVSFAPKTSYNCVVISCPEIVQGNTYTLSAGTESQEIEMTSLLYGNGGMNGGRGGMGGGRPGNMQGDMGGQKGGMRGEGQMPEGQPPALPNGEMPEGMPQMPNGEMPEGMPQMPNGELPQGVPSEGMPDGQRPQGITQ